MKILKFGGTSVGTPEDIRNVGAIIAANYNDGFKCAVVVSAMKGVTDKFIDMSDRAARGDESYLSLLNEIENHHFDTARELINVQSQSRVFAYLKTLINELDDLLHGTFLLRECSERTMALVLSFGERLSAYILSQYIKELGIDTEFLDARQLIKTNKNFSAAKVKYPETQENILDYFKHHTELQVITGFISSTHQNETTTLGRGGSDYTAAIFGAALNAEVIEIWTDVDGIMTADPKEVDGAFSLDAVSYIEAMEMSHFGAKIIYPPTLLPILHKHIPLKIKNTFNPDFPGTLVSRESSSGVAPDRSHPVKAISSIKETTLLSVEGGGMVGIPGISSRLFGALAHNQINVIIITQASSEHSISFAVDPKDSGLAKQALQEEFSLEIQSGKIDDIAVEKDLSIVSIIGENMRSTSGISGKLFGTLGRNGINVRAIAQGSSEVNLSVVIGKKDLSKALNSLHEAFFLSDTKSLNIFLVGVGLIGGTLLQQIQKQLEYLYKERYLKMRFIGIANTKKMAIDKLGINLNEWRERLDNSEEASDITNFVHQIKELNLPNSVFVDCTSAEKITKYYQEILKNSISIITPNKLANSGEYKEYRQLKETAKQAGVRFLYETNVGAGLPVISVLQELKDSGDIIYKVEGVLSGTLSFIFNTFGKGKKFSEVVKEAKALGYTEPDPRDDLNGMDVARKILILAREVGLKLEPDDVKIENILPQPCLDAGNIDEFFDELENANPRFEQYLEDAEKENKVLRFIAKLEDGHAQVALEAVGPEHPFYSLSGSDNIISYTTARYYDRPLVVKGPGAGAEVTAAGVFAEIISISNYLYQDNFS